MWFASKKVFISSVDCAYEAYCCISLLSSLVCWSHESETFAVLFLHRYIDEAEMHIRLCSIFCVLLSFLYLFLSFFPLISWNYTQEVEGSKAKPGLDRRLGVLYWCWTWNGGPGSCEHPVDSGHCNCLAGRSSLVPLMWPNSSGKGEADVKEWISPCSLGCCSLSSPA